MQTFWGFGNFLFLFSPYSNNLPVNLNELLILTLAIFNNIEDTLTNLILLLVHGNCTNMFIYYQSNGSGRKYNLFINHYIYNHVIYMSVWSNDFLPKSKQHFMKSLFSMSRNVHSIHLFSSMFRTFTANIYVLQLQHKQFNPHAFHLHDKRPSYSIMSTNDKMKSLIVNASKIVTVHATIPERPYAERAASTSVLSQRVIPAHTLSPCAYWRSKKSFSNCDYCDMDCNSSTAKPWL